MSKYKRDSQLLKNRDVNDVSMLNTGDILFTYNGIKDVWYDVVISNQSFAEYENIGMVIKNPNFNDIQLYGLYVLEIKQLYSGCKGKPALTNYKDFINGCTKVDARCWNNLSSDNDNKIKKIYNNYLSSNQYYCGSVGKFLSNCGFACCIAPHEELFFWPAELIIFLLREMKLVFPKKHIASYTIHDISTLFDDTIQVRLSNLIRII